MSREFNLTVHQQVWLAAYTASLQSIAKYNPKNEALECLKEFDMVFGSAKVKKLLTEMASSNKINVVIDDRIGTSEANNEPAPDLDKESEK